MESYIGSDRYIIRYDTSVITLPVFDDNDSYFIAQSLTNDYENCNILTGLGGE
jgi:hypothetical protein